MRDGFVKICPSFIRLRTHAAQIFTRHTQNAAGAGHRTQQPVYILAVWFLLAMIHPTESTTSRS